MSAPEPKQHAVYVFIDASNVWQAQKAKGKVFNYEALRSHLKTTFDASDIKVFYYTAYPAQGTRNYDLLGKHNFFTYLKKALGFVVRKKELKRIVAHTDAGDVVFEKGNMDVEMTIDTIHHMAAYDTAIFFTGDSDFLALTTYLKNRGKKVFVFSSKNNISRELRTGSDGYFDILDMSTSVWGKNLTHRREV